MLDQILRWLGLIKPGIEQTGFIEYIPQGTDYLGNTLPYEIRNAPGKWEPFLPEGEQQNIPFTFDTKSCVTFSLSNVAETTLQGIPLPEAHRNFLTGHGYYKNGKLNFSDRFIAIMAGTTENGNTYKKVADTMRKNGLIPDTMLPFGGQTFQEYHGIGNITQEMKLMGQKFLSFFDIAYEFGYVNPGYADLDSGDIEEIQYHLKQAPLAIAVPVPSSHAIMMASYYNVFESYAPFYRKGTRKIHYVFKLVITPKVQAVSASMRIGSRGEEVKKLQEKLGIHADGVFGKLTEVAVKAFQEANGLTPDGIVGPATRAVLNTGNKRELVDALILVESGGNDYAIGDLDLKDKAYGCLQIRKPCVDDVNRFFGTKHKAEDMKGNRELSKDVFAKYISIYATESKIGRPVTDEDRARIWNGGPTGWKRESTVAYWKKVEAKLR